MATMPQSVQPTVKQTQSLSRDLPKECMLLRIFIGEGDEFQGRPLYKAIVLRARELRLAGATVLRGRMGYGRSQQLHNATVLRLSFALPMILAPVDTPAQTQAFLPELTH